jgi:hypothetical protein
VTAIRASVVLVLVLFAARGAVPPCASACSCVPIGPLADYVADGSAAVMAGTVGATIAGTRYSFVVERWYAGPGAAAIVTIEGGDGAMCGVSLTPGERLVFVATRDETGDFLPSICAPFARLTTPEGAALLAEADRTFGGGATPAPEASPATDAGDPIGGPTGEAPSLLFAGGAIAAGVVVLGAAILAARRRSPGA